MTQEFHLSVTPVGEAISTGATYLVRTELVEPGVPLAEEQVEWPIAHWLDLTARLMGDSLFYPSALSQEALLLAQSEDLLQFGQQLYAALFQGTIAQSWTTAQGIAHNRGEALRLRLRLKDAQIIRLPWEVLHGGDRPLTTNTEILFSRYHPAPRMRPSPDRAIANPLKILMVLSGPNDRQGLALDREMNRLKAEFEHQPFLGLKIQLDILTSADREQLTQTLEQRQYHIFHYSGHSRPSAFGGEIYLHNQQNGLTEQLNGEDLAGLLVNNGISMALFNSCWSAGAGEQTLAESLLKRGIPCVLAMGDRIPDQVAITFSQLFYRNLKREYGIDLSLNRTRQGLISAYGSNSLYFALPILYLQPGFDQFIPDRPEVRLPVVPVPVSSLAEPVYPPLTSPISSERSRSDSVGVSPNPQEPSDCHSFDRLGCQLYEEGKITAAMEAYQLALATNPYYVDAYYHLGLALHRQGRIEDAVEAYRQALDLDPEHPQANLALNGVLEQAPATPPVPPPPTPAPAAAPQRRGHWILSLSGGGVLVAVVMGVVLARNVMPWWTVLRSPRGSLPVVADLPQPENENVALMQGAIAQFRQGNFSAGAIQVEKLLDSSVINYALEALRAVPSQQQDHPQISYLWGRLAWQAIQQGNSDYSVDDARRYWEQAVKGDPRQPDYYNALGFAYYAEGNLGLAEKSFAQAIALTDTPTAPQRLTAYAGTALVYAQKAREDEAAQVYQFVMQADPSQFQPQALGTQSWLWTNTAIAQWQFLSTRTSRVAEKVELERP